jgi:hypothetical protein
MSTVQIQVKAVYPAKEGKKFGAILAEDGARYVLPKTVPTGHVQKGMMAVIDYHQEDWKDGTVHIVNSINAEMRADHVNGSPAYNPAAKDRTIFIQGVAQAALHGMSWTNEMTVREAIFSAVDAARDAYSTFILEAPAKPSPAPAAAPATNYRESGQPYGGGDPRFDAPPPSPSDYGAHRK